MKKLVARFEAADKDGWVVVRCRRRQRGQQRLRQARLARPSRAVNSRAVGVPAPFVICAHAAMA